MFWEGFLRYVYGIFLGWIVFGRMFFGWICSVQYCTMSGLIRFVINRSIPAPVHRRVRKYSKKLFGVKHVTPGSMNRLFGDLFRKFEEVVLGVFGTIWGCSGDIL